jgi:hypothetical protein
MSSRPSQSRASSRRPASYRRPSNVSSNDRVTVRDGPNSKPISASRATALPGSCSSAVKVATSMRVTRPNLPAPRPHLPCHGRDRTPNSSQREGLGCPKPVCHALRKRRRLGVLPMGVLCPRKPPRPSPPSRHRTPIPVTQPSVQSIRRAQLARSWNSLHLKGTSEAAPHKSAR